jgi:hypothetical protein
LGLVDSAFLGDCGEGCVVGLVSEDVAEFFDYVGLWWFLGFAVVPVEGVALSASGAVGELVVAVAAVDAGSGDGVGSLGWGGLGVAVGAVPVVWVVLVLFPFVAGGEFVEVCHGFSLRIFWIVCLVLCVFRIESMLRMVVVIICFCTFWCVGWLCFCCRSVRLFCCCGLRARGVVFWC